MGITDYWHVVFQHRWKIVGLILIIAVAVGGVLFFLDPLYEATCKVLLINEQKTGAAENYTLDDFLMQSLGKSDPILTHLEMLKTRPVIDEVIRRCEIQNKDGELVSAWEFSKKIKVEQIKMTNLLKITCRDKSSEKAALYANVLAEVFSEKNQALNRQKVTNVKEFIRDQINEQKKKVEKAEKMVIDFKARSNTISLEKETSVRVAARAELEAERIKLQSELKGVEAQRREIENRLQEAGSRSLPGYSSLMAAQEQIAITLKGLLARLHSVDRQIARQNRNMKNIPPLEIELAGLEREERIMNEIYSTLLSKYEEYKIREAADVGSITVLEPAVPPGMPVFPPRKKGLILAVFAGLFLALGWAFFLEYTKDRPQSIHEIERLLGTTSLGAVPVLYKESTLFLMEKPRSLAAESVRLVYANLKFKQILSKDHVALMVTSAQPGEGKSLISANLSLAFSSSGYRTALVSLDLRSVAFKELFNREFSLGITDYVLGDADLGQIAWNADFDSNLTIISGGSTITDPVMARAVPRLKSLIEKLKTSFDVVLFDTAPITMASETLHLARGVDGIILVADHFGISRKGLKLMNGILQGKELPVMGVVVNRVERYHREVNHMYRLYRD